MTTDNTTTSPAPQAPLARSLRIAGYGTLALVALALFIAMCAILRDGALDREAALRAATGALVARHGTANTGDGSPDVTPESSQAPSPG
ncbi:MAG: hypothetical protein GAK40_01443 [Burkholderia plantarii]|nr:MAG: hypothetical protein GAK40_01443 [Burkholderia plantarii]